MKVQNIKNQKKLIDLIKNNVYDNEMALSEYEGYKEVENIEFHLNYADAMRKNQKFDIAIEIYDNIIRLFPMNLWAYVLKGNCLNKVKKYREAEKIFTLTIEKFPDKIKIIDSLNDRKDIAFVSNISNISNISNKKMVSGTI